MKFNQEARVAKRRRQQRINAKLMKKLGGALSEAWGIRNKILTARLAK